MTRSLLLFAALFGAFTMNAQPIITQQPQDQTVCPGECTTLEVTAVGGGLSYQWMVIDGMDSTEVSGAVSDEITYCETDSAGVGVELACVVADSNGSMTSSNAAIVSVDSCLPPVADFTWEWNHLEQCFMNTSQRATTVFWLFGDGSTNDDNVDSICHTYGTKEIYYVKLQAFNDYGSDVVEKVLDLLDVNEVKNEALKLFPNPSSTIATISSEELLEQVTVFDAQGKITQSYPVNTRSYTLNTSNLSSGIYTIHITTESSVLTRRLVVR